MVQLADLDSTEVDGPAYPQHEAAWPPRMEFAPVGSGRSSRIARLRPDASTGRDGTRRDPDADRFMGVICREHVPPLFRYLLRLAQGDQQIAEDLLQEALLRAWRNIEQLEAAPESVRPWLFTVARNHAIDVIRARQARPAELGMPDANRVAAPRDAVEHLLNTTALRRALDALTPAHSAVIVELYFRDATLVETAQRLGIPKGTVKSRAHYALRALRDALGPLDP